MSTAPTTTIAGDRPAENALYSASQWRLMWLKFRKHRLAVAGGAMILTLYLVAALCELIAPYPLEYRNTKMIYAPPQQLRWVSDQGWHLRPFVYRLEARRDPQTLRLSYVEDRTRLDPVQFFVRGEPYRFWGLIPADLHLLGVPQGGTLYLLGTDQLGQDLFSRMLYGARISLTVGLIGVSLSAVLGLIIGAVSGFYGGWVDTGIQRLIEMLRSFPSIPLWMGLSAAVPADWSPLAVYFAITVVLSVIGWTGLAREVRGKILSLREEDFTTAALLAGASRWRVMTRHLLPSLTSHIIVTLTLAIPGMILGETALSFLGLGLRPPITSWGVLLKEAQNVQTLVLHPWLLAPVALVIVTVLAFNFLGDGLRDAADPYHR